jgi:hypothetical protein
MQSDEVTAPGAQRRRVFSERRRRWNSRRRSASDGGFESMVVGDWCFLRRRRGAAGDFGGLGDRRGARKAAGKGGVMVSFDAPERGKDNRGVEERGEGSPHGCRRKSAACLHGLRRGISPAWRLRIEREGEEKGEGVSGFIGTGLMAS